MQDGIVCLTRFLAIAVFLVCVFWAIFARVIPASSSARRNSVPALAKSKPNSPSFTNISRSSELLYRRTVGLPLRAEQSTIPQMLRQTRAKWLAMMGYAFAAAGILLYTQLDKIENWRTGLDILNVAALCSIATTFGGFLISIVGSAIWARRNPTHQPLKIAFASGVVSILLCLMVNVNVHGPSSILMFLVPFSVVNVLSILVAGGW